MLNRIFLIVLDSVGVGDAPDAADYGDEGANTVGHIVQNTRLQLPHMARIAFGHIPGTGLERDPAAAGAFGRLTEASRGKDTTTGHWEIAGLTLHEPFPTYPNGFPPEIIVAFEAQTGRRVLCNQPYSGTAVIADFGKQHMETGDLIVYTSADSVFQIAAHEQIVPVEQLYAYCRIARDILQGKHAVGRVIARPFTGEWPFTRTSRRHDFSLTPPDDTMLDVLQNAGLDVIGVGKIYDIFAGKGLRAPLPTTGNNDGMEKTMQLLYKPFHGLCFVNLVDFDMLYGHRNDAPGYARALSDFDRWLGAFLPQMKENDLLMITADHGCDPLTESTDHSREYIPLLICGSQVHPCNLGTRSTYADIGKTVCDLFGISNTLSGTSFLPEIGGDT